MSAARYNLIIDQGTDFALEFIVKGVRNSKGLYGLHARAQLRSTKDSVSSSLQRLSIAIEDGRVTGKITAKLTNTETSAIAAGRYYYDLELVAFSVVTRLLEGTVTVTQEVTR